MFICLFIIYTFVDYCIQVCSVSLWVTLVGRTSLIQNRLGDLRLKNNYSFPLQVLEQQRCKLISCHLPVRKSPLTPKFVFIQASPSDFFWIHKLKQKSRSTLKSEDGHCPKNRYTDSNRKIRLMANQKRSKCKSDCKTCKKA